MTKYFSMGKKNFLLIVAVVVMLINIYHVICNQQLNNLKDHLEHRNVDLERAIQNQQSFNDELIIHMQLYRLMSEFQIDLNTKVRLENGTTKCIKDISSNTMQLVFRFNEFTCKSCLFEEFSKLDSISNIIGHNNIIILGAYESDKDLFIVKRLLRMKHHIYNVKMGDFDCSIDSCNVPYMFIMDKDYYANNIFIPLKVNNKLTDEYYKTIVNLFEETGKDLQKE